MYKNVAGQKISVFAWNNATGQEATGEAANITAQISIDGGASAATNDVNPTELDATNHKGVYVFDLLQAETNGDMIVISPACSTDDIVFRPIIEYPTLLTATKAAFIDASIATNSVDINSALSNQVLMAVDLTAIKAKTDNLPSGIPKNVALSDFEFLMVKKSDHVTPKTGLSVTGQISQDGAAFAALTNTPAEVGLGTYKVDLTAGEMNADVLTLVFSATGADQRTITIKTSS